MSRNLARFIKLPPRPPLPPINERLVEATAEAVAKLNRVMKLGQVDHEAGRKLREAVWRDVPATHHRYIAARLVSLHTQGDW